MKKSILTTAFIIFFACIAMVPAQQDENNLNRTSEISSTKAELLLSGDELIQPLMEIWYNACHEKNSDLDITFSTTENVGDVKAFLKNESGMLMYSVSGLDLPEDYWQLKIAREAVVPAFNHTGEIAELVREKGLTQEELIRVFTSGNAVTWGELLDTDNNEPVHVYMLEQEDGASDVWARFIFTEAENLKGRVMKTDKAMVEDIAGDPIAIGFCNLKYAFNLETKMPVEHVGILPLDLNANGKTDYIERIPEELKAMQRVIWLGSYPNNLSGPYG